MSLAPGTGLGAYEIIAALGAGGMGEVYRARDTRLNRDVALKILPIWGIDDPDFRARFKREAQALAALNSPHIAAIHDVIDFDGHQAIIMELGTRNDAPGRDRPRPCPGASRHWLCDRHQ